MADGPINHADLTKPHQNSSYQARVSFPVGSRLRKLGSGHVLLPGVRTQELRAWDHLRPHAMCPFTRLALKCILCPGTDHKKSISLSPLSLSSELSKRWGVKKPSHLEPVGWKCGCPWDPGIGSWHLNEGGPVGDCALSPWGVPWLSIVAPEPHCSAAPTTVLVCSDVAAWSHVPKDD